jgi:hypothetical protein
MDVLDMAAVFAGVTHTGSLVMDMEGTVQQATGELEGNSEEVGRVVSPFLFALSTEQHKRPHLRLPLGLHWL